MYIEDVWEFFRWIAVIALVIFGIHACNQSDWYQASKAADAAQARADQTPHVIREADGCKVYAFKSNNYWHYFTRCGSTVTTDASHGERSGKTTKTVTETITTQGNS